MRLPLFIAVTPTPAQRVRVCALLSALRPLAPRAKWVREEGLHLTLAFLGATEEAAVEGVTAAMDEAAEGHAPLALTLAGGGGFGAPGAPRVLWVGVGGEAERLGRLQAELAMALRARGFSLEARPFRAHLTLARARKPRGDQALREAVRALESFDAGVGEVDALELYQSTLTPEGSRYTLKHRSPLRGPRNLSTTLRTL